MACSEKDLISVYIDGELPDIYKEKFEKHLENCQECKKIYDSFNSRHELFSSSSKSFVSDKDYLDESFARLQTKLSYSKVAGKKNIFAFDPGFASNNSFGKALARSVISASAAAAVFACIFVPVYKSAGANMNSKGQELTAIARTELTPVNEQKVIADKNFSNIKIAPVSSYAGNSLAKVSSSESFVSGKTEFSPAEEKFEINEELFDAVNAEQNINKNQKVVNAAMASYGSFNSMGSIDVFKPGFIEADGENFAGFGEMNPYANRNVSNMNFRPPMDRSLDRRMGPPPRRHHHPKKNFEEN